MKYETKNTLSLADYRFLCRNKLSIDSNNNQYNNYKENPANKIKCDSNNKFKINNKLLVNMF